MSIKYNPRLPICYIANCYILFICGTSSFKAPGVQLTILGYHHKPYLLTQSSKNNSVFSVSSHLLDIKFKNVDIWLTKMFLLGVFSVSQTSFHMCHIFRTQTFWLPCINASMPALKVIMMCQNSLNQQESTKIRLQQDFRGAVALFTTRGRYLPIHCKR